MRPFGHGKTRRTGATFTQKGNDRQANGSCSRTPRPGTTHFARWQVSWLSGHRSMPVFPAHGQ